MGDTSFRLGGMGSHQSSLADSIEWLTPPGLHSALGRFDLDPCAAPEPRPWPTAARHITLPDDGLAAPWEGRVWLNPPYGRETWRWMDRLAHHGCGTALIFARTDTDGFVSTVWQKATAMLFLAGRLTFHRPDGAPADYNGGAPSVLVAYGADDADRLRQSSIAGAFLTDWQWQDSSAADPRLFTLNVRGKL